MGLRVGAGKAAGERVCGARWGRTTAFLCAGLLLVIAIPAEAFELKSGISVGGLQVGTEPKLAVSPFVGFLWHTEGGLLIEAHNMFSILPGAHVGIYDRTAATVGYAWKAKNVSLGPSLSIYSMLVCGLVICRRVMGVAPGGHAQIDWYLAERVGVSVSGNLDWAGGSSRVLPGGLVVMVTAGPILRFQVGSK